MGFYLGKNNLVAACFAILFGAWIVFDTYTSFSVQVSSHIGGGISAAGYPRLLGILAILLGGLLLVPGFGIDEERQGDSFHYHMVAAALAILFGYLLVLPWVGHFIANAALAAGMLLIGGERRLRHLLVYVSILTFVFFMVFRYGADIFMPEGELIKRLGR
ncbi:MAG: tripartite tricarboxylate transporter TctB family protein [Pseudomonadota bacterium]